MEEAGKQRHINWLPLHIPRWSWESNLQLRYGPLTGNWTRYPSARRLTPWEKPGRADDSFLIQSFIIMVTNGLSNSSIPAMYRWLFGIPQEAVIVFLQLVCLNPDPNKAHTLHLVEMSFKSFTIKQIFLHLKKPCNHLMQKSVHVLPSFYHSGIYCLRPWSVVFVCFCMSHISEKLVGKS